MQNNNRSSASSRPELLIIDNYDSFTYNLVQAFGELGVEPVVFRNDSITLNRIARLRPERIVISPGPGRPEGAGISVPLIRRMLGKVPLLGVCLGHQCLGFARGARVIRGPEVMHGKPSRVFHDGDGLFRNVPRSFSAMRYHSLILDPESLPAEFIVSARTEDGIIMGIRHQRYPAFGVQFHPESFLTPAGKIILKNFLSQSIEKNRNSPNRRGNI
ncbi:MAG: aminodeoxychorismate/anthranilate synthase component II [Proteobacteria bacterium]|nr:aminodeoxychorismate/anthranilate synthase component II [Pseudomonadota bacterium]